MASVLVAFRFPQVQQYATQKASTYLSHKIKTRVELERIEIVFPKSISIRKLYVEDESSDTLFYGQSIKIDLNLWDLLSKKIILNSIELEALTGRISRRDLIGRFNFSFIPDAFSSAEKDTTPSQEKPDTSPWEFSIRKVSLKKSSFSFHDRQSGWNADIHLGNFETGFDKFDLQNMLIHLNTITLENTDISILQEKPLLMKQDITSNEPFKYAIDLDKLNLSGIRVKYNSKVSAQQLLLSLRRLQLGVNTIDLEKEWIDLDKLLLQGADIQFIQNKPMMKDTGTNTSPEEALPFNWVLTLNTLNLEDNDLVYHNNNSLPLKNTMDLNHLEIKSMFMKGKDLYASSKKINIDLNDFRFTEKNGLSLKKFQAKISYDTTHAELKNLDLRLNNSRVTDYLAVNYSSPAAIADSLHTLRLRAGFKHTYISIKDLAFFSPGLLKRIPLKDGAKNEAIAVSGKIEGTVNDLRFSRLELTAGSTTSIKLNGSLKDLTNPKTLYASSSFEFVSTKKDITWALHDSLIPENISIPDSITLTGSFRGYAKNFNADALLKTSFGSVQATVKMDPGAGNREQAYEADIRVLAFDMGRLLMQPQMFGPVTLIASVKGSGFDTSDLNAVVKVNSVKAVLKNYEYKNFSLYGTIWKKAFTGQASMHDENLAFTFNGGIDLEPSHPKYTFTLDLSGADLKALHLSESDLRMSAHIQSDIGALPGKNVSGVASIRNALIIRNAKRYPVDSIVLRSEINEGITSLRLRSGIMNADFKGELSLKELPATVKQHINSYFNMQDTTLVTSTPGKQKFTFSLTIVDPAIITENFVPHLEKLTPIAIQGAYDSERKDIKLTVSVPQIKYSGVTVDSLKLAINSDTHKLNYDLSAADVFNPTFRFENLSLGGEVANNSLNFQFNTAKDDSSRLLAIGGTIKSTNRDFELKLDQELILNAERWSIDKTNYIHFGKERLYANNVSISNGSQFVSVNSKEKTPASPLEIRFKNFDLTTLSRLVENKKDLVNGTVNGQIIFEKQNNSPAFRSDLVISDFAFQAVPVGNIKLQVSNVEDLKKYKVHLSMKGNGNDILLQGFYNTSGTNDMDLLVDIRNLDLRSVEPFTFKQLSQMSGSINGKLHLKGPVALPDISGALNFKEAAFNPRFIDSYLTIRDSRISFDEKTIRLTNFIIHDSLDHTANVNGTVDVHDLKNIRLNLRLKTDDFLALNTTRLDNPLYYGKIIIDSDIRITGTTEAPTVDMKAKLNKGSVLTYVKPESQVSRNESKSVVEFINPSNQDISIMARKNDSIDGGSRMKGIELNASVNFDRSVELKMIVDRSTGDSLYIQGGGLLEFGLDRSGKTSLSGKYNIMDGGYFLSLENLVKRSFKIQKGSSVTWAGDVLDAYVDITAIYAIKTSPLDLVQNELAGLNELEKNKYRNSLNFLVYLKMSGFISAPEISFDIQLAPGDRGAVNGAVNTKLAQLREDESQLNKQVFALLTLRRFIGENPLESSNDGGISSASRSSASKVLTQQLSSLSDKYVNFVDLDLGVNSFEDYSSGQQEGRTQLQLGVSKQLFSDKVTVRVGGNVDLEGERATQNDANDVAGNISIDYKLTEDGRYKLEASRENQYENPIEGELTKTAAGIIYTRNFNTFKQLFSKPKSELERRKEKRERKRRKKEKRKPKPIKPGH